jgi:signal transduction histidine kinase
MNDSPVDKDSERLLLLPHARRDGDVAREVLAEIRIASEVCSSAGSLCREIERGAGGALIAEERLSAEVVATLRATLAKQPPWSDFPLLIIGTRSARTGDYRTSSLPSLGNVTLIDAPVRMRTLVHAARAAVRTRRRQYTARQAIEQRDLFLAMLGHELRNPLSVISLAVQLASVDPVRAAKQWPVLQRQVEHLSVLLDDLLDVARVTSGKIVLERRPVELDELLRRFVASARTRFENAKLALDLVVSPEAVGCVEVSGDVVRLEQVLNNLLTNALKYTMPGGEVVVTLALDDDVAEVRVRDSGIGIGPEMLPRVFELFTQAQTSLARADGGMGVGLSLVRTLVELHGGEVLASSDGLGRGSTFAIRLPVAAAPELRHSEPGLYTSRLGAGGRDIVVVEDNSDSRRLLVDALERAGHQVEAAADGESGLALLLARRPDAAIVDIGLPGIDGYEVARRARTAHGSELLLIALTGYGQLADRARALDAGFDVHLTKPPVINSLCALLSSRLSAP